MLQVVPIINIPGFGDRAAEKVCTDMKIQSQNDRDKLDEAKKQVYLKGFTEGVLTVGPHAGKKVGSQPARSGSTCIACRRDTGQSYIQSCAHPGVIPSHAVSRQGGLLASKHGPSESGRASWLRAQVCDVKAVIRAEMLGAGQALPYSEPERQVMSRSGDVCVVALTDQWYLNYGEDEWRDATRCTSNLLSAG